MCRELTAWEKCVEFHGHVCPGLSMGFKAALVAMKELAVERAGDEELLVIVENDACGVDAVQVLTGCTIGKGNLLYRDYGKQVYIFGNRKTGAAVRVAVRSDVMQRSPGHRQLQQKVMSGQASPEEQQAFRAKHLELSQIIRDLPDEEFCKVQKIDFPFPTKARIFDSIVCAQCGEQVMEPRTRVKGGQMVCLECFGEDYSRGW